MSRPAAAASRLPSVEKTGSEGARLPVTANRCRLRPVAASHSRTPLAGTSTVATKLPSGEKATASRPPPKYRRRVPRRAIAPGGSGSPWRSRRGPVFAPGQEGRRGGQARQERQTEHDWQAHRTFSQRLAAATAGHTVPVDCEEDATTDRACVAAGGQLSILQGRSRSCGRGSACHGIGPPWHALPTPQVVAHPDTCVEGFLCVPRHAWIRARPDWTQSRSWLCTGSIHPRWLPAMLNRQRVARFPALCLERMPGTASGGRIRCTPNETKPADASHCQ